MSSTDMTRDYLREFDEWWSPMEEQWKSSPKLIDIKGVVRVGYLAGRKADEEALLASKQEGRAEAVAQMCKYIWEHRTAEDGDMVYAKFTMEGLSLAAKEEVIAYIKKNSYRENELSAEGGDGFVVSEEVLNAAKEEKV